MFRRSLRRCEYWEGGGNCNRYAEAKKGKPVTSSYAGHLTSITRGRFFLHMLSDENINEEIQLIHQASSCETSPSLLLYIANFSLSKTKENTIASYFFLSKLSFF